jgi:hypothetical protein
LGKYAHTSVLAFSVNDIMIAFQHKVTDTLSCLFASSPPSSANCFSIFVPLVKKVGTGTPLLGLQNDFNAPFSMDRLLRLLYVAHNAFPGLHVVHS